MPSLKQLRHRLKQGLIRTMIVNLTRPRTRYEHRVPNNIEKLKQEVRKGDVILIEGDQRISQVIKYITQSAWSQAALYIGDELRQVNPAVADAMEEKYGAEAQHLIIETTISEGVICHPLAKYHRYNLRICRPKGLQRDHLDRILRHLIKSVGWRHDVRRITELSRYLFPVTLIPPILRPIALRYSGRATREVICSTMIARAFQDVGYPIRPTVSVDQSDEQQNMLSRLLRRNGRLLGTLYMTEDPTLIRPRDFDLSPYFDIVKSRSLGTGKFDYRDIQWVDDNGPESDAGTSEKSASVGNETIGNEGKSTP